MNFSIKARNLSIIVSAFALTACTSVPRDGGIGPVEDIFEQRLERQIRLPQPGKQMPMTVEQVDQLLLQPLTLENAERMSIEANPALKAALAQVGVAEADYAQAGRMENPGLSYERFSSNDNSASLLFDIGGLFLMPLKRQLERRRLEAARYQAAVDVLSHIGNTRQSWIKAVAEKQQTALIKRALESVETSNNLIRQMAALGHSNVIEAAQSELVLGEMRATMTRQKLAEGAARETLIRQLGLWGQQARTLDIPDQLPALPVQSR